MFISLCVYMHIECTYVHFDWNKIQYGLPHCHIILYKQNCFDMRKRKSLCVNDIDIDIIRKYQHAGHIKR